MKRRGALIVILLGAPLLAGCLDDGLVGKPVPAFEVVTFDGQRVNETTYAGKWLILDLMATWCGPCKLEVAHLREVQRVHGDQVVILSVSVEPTDTVEAMEQFGEEHGVQWASALDPGGKMADAMGLGIIPKLVLVDPEGVVAFEAQGEVLPAAITRVVDPSAAPPPNEFPWGATLAGLAAGFVAWLNPYRRFHREGTRASSLLALALFAGLGLLAWRFAAFASGRATLSSLFIGALALVAVAWWFRARRKEAPRPPDHIALSAGDRVYEGGAHFLLAGVFALNAGTTLGFFAPIVAFLAGAGASALARDRMTERTRTALGLAGLALVGVALVAFGMRLVLAEQ